MIVKFHSTATDKPEVGVDVFLLDDNGEMAVGSWDGQGWKWDDCFSCSPEGWPYWLENPLEEARGQ